MSDRPRFDDSALRAAIQPARAPATLDRVGRVRLLGEAAKALLDGRPLSRKAALFLGGAMLAWLEGGGDLERDYLKVRALAGSHQTPTQLWQRIASSRGAQEPGRLNKVEPPSSKSEPS